jgi:glycosyltransferase involved in cell wall biosynthesis
MKKVIVVAYAFPPVGGGGVQRVAKFVKYLREFQWEPLVLTVANPSVPIVDAAMLRDIPIGVKISHAASFEPSYAQKQLLGAPGGGGARLKLIAKKFLSGLLLPDVQVLWWPGLVRSLISMIRNDKPDCIFVTAPPFSCFLPVVAIGNFFKIPVVADFRDEWAFSRNQLENSSKGAIAKAIDSFSERYVVRRCTAITAATQSYISTLVCNYKLPAEVGTAITNGFDEDDFVFDEQLQDAATSKEIVIVYSGTVWRATSLKNFIDSLQFFYPVMREYNRRFRVNIFGRIVESELLYIKSSEARGVVEVFDYVEHHKLMSIICSADILLLVLSNLPGAEKIITAKLFEYMATGKHIFAIIPEGETKRILVNQYDNVTFANPDDVEDIKNKLTSVLNSYDTIKKKKGKDVSQYSRRCLTGQLSEVLSRVSSGETEIN